MLCSCTLYVFTANSEVAQIISATGEALSVPAPGMQDGDPCQCDVSPEGKPTSHVPGINRFHL